MVSQVEGKKEANQSLKQEKKKLKTSLTQKQ